MVAVGFLRSGTATHRPQSGGRRHGALADLAGRRQRQVESRTPPIDERPRRLMKPVGPPAPVQLEIPSSLSQAPCGVDEPLVRLIERVGVVRRPGRSGRLAAAVLGREIEDAGDRAVQMGSPAPQRHSLHRPAGVEYPSGLAVSSDHVEGQALSVAGPLVHTHVGNHVFEGRRATFTAPMPLSLGQMPEVGR